MEVEHVVSSAVCLKKFKASPRCACYFVYVWVHIFVVHFVAYIYAFATVVLIVMFWYVSWLYIYIFFFIIYTYQFYTSTWLGMHFERLRLPAGPPRVISCIKNYKPHYVIPIQVWFCLLGVCCAFFLEATRATALWDEHSNQPKTASSRFLKLALSRGLELTLQRIKSWQKGPYKIRQYRI